MQAKEKKQIYNKNRRYHVFQKLIFQRKKIYYIVLYSKPKFLLMILISLVLFICLLVGFKIFLAKSKSIDIFGSILRTRPIILAKLRYYPTVLFSLIGIFSTRIVVFLLLLDSYNSCLIILS
jgi:hypothetical protein